MDLESECLVSASVEDNEENKNVSALEKLENIGASKVENNGSCDVENNDSNELLPDVKGKGTEASVSVSSPPVEMKSEMSPSPALVRKGYGLKKWRRIKRDVSKGGDSSEDTGNMVMQELSNSVVNPSKRAQVYVERQQKSEGSVSSTPVVGGLDVFSLPVDSGFAMGPSVDAGTDSENSEDRSSKSSTAASVPKIKYEIPAVVGFPHDKIRMRSLSGKNLTHSVQRGQQGKGRTEPIKKARGDRVKIEKENSQSSMESDLRSSNFAFMKGTYANGIRNERPVHHDGENGDEFQGSERQFGDGLRDGYSRDSEGGYEDNSPEDVVADLSWDAKEERRENHDSSSDQDPLIESIFLLQSAQEALEKEVLKFKEIGKDASVDGSVSDTQPDFTDVEHKSSEQFPSGVGVQSFPRDLQSQEVEIAIRDVEAELEDLFKQRIEAEVEYLAISRTVQKLKVAAVDQTIISEEQKAPASELIQNKLGEKATMLKKDAEKLQIFCEDIASAHETLKLQKSVCKYTSYFFMQLLLLFIILGVFIFQLSPNYVEVVPT
ncbi:hypothetical protein DH2020_008761 [Rehmannia glutinosa]|uniref:WPP domain-interacting protein n=1 Tax=Rehmannia glutinosa TaxID=99300 RepID=A0ABR0X4D2_REHGL